MAGAAGGAASRSYLWLSNAVDARKWGPRSERKRKELDSRITHTLTTHNSNDDDKFNNLEKLTAGELVDATRLLKCQKRQIEAIRRLLSIRLLQWIQSTLFFLPIHTWSETSATSHNSRLERMQLRSVDFFGANVWITKKRLDYKSWMVWCHVNYLRICLG